MIPLARDFLGKNIEMTMGFLQGCKIANWSIVASLPVAKIGAHLKSKLELTWELKGQL
jgi:hypothetical protein